MPDLDDTIEEGQDKMGCKPIGDYLNTYEWAMKKGQSFVQLINDSFGNK